MFPRLKVTAIKNLECPLKLTKNVKSTEEDPESNKPPLINYHLSIYYSNNEAQTKRETAKLPINKENNEEEIERTASKTVSKMNEKCPSLEK